MKIPGVERETPRETLGDNFIMFMKKKPAANPLSGYINKKQKVCRGKSIRLM